MSYWEQFSDEELKKLHAYWTKEGRVRRTKQERAIAKSNADAIVKEQTIRFERKWLG